MGKLGIIYPDGTKNNWVWRLAEVRKLTKEEQKDPQYGGHEYTLDLENAKSMVNMNLLTLVKKWVLLKNYEEYHLETNRTWTNS